MFPQGISMRRTLVTVVCAALLAAAAPAGAYSVLTHEAIIDTTWDDGIRPILVRRFGSSAAALREARAYAYGGCIVQDMGYYPLSSRTFGDLVHYVRSGDFVLTLIRQARTMNELAFALGALAHYTADNYGHPIGINRAVPILFPKVAAKFGNPVTYEDHPTSHLRTEFSFDVVQIARGRYLSEDYHDFIGFQVSKPLLERAFQATYSLELDDVFRDVDMAIATFRWSVGSILPALTKAAWDASRDKIASTPTPRNADVMPFTYTRRDHEERWGANDQRPGFGHRVLGLLLRVIPKIGPFKTAAIRVPTPEAERVFLASFRTVILEYRRRLAALSAGTLTLPDRNFDTGQPIRAGEYRLADEAFAALVNRLAEQKFAGVTAALRARILAFYAEPDAPIATKADRRDWRELSANLSALKAYGATPAGRSALTTSRVRSQGLKP
jgi:hypothetical protein